MTKLLSCGSAFRSARLVHRDLFGIRALTTATCHQNLLFSTKPSPSRLPNDGLTLGDFVQQAPPTDKTNTTRQRKAQPLADNYTFHLKTYGCQMNVNDSDICRSLLLDAGLQETSDEGHADVLLTNTCAIREGAENKVFHRLKELRSRYRKQNKIVGVLGCMAERLKTDLFENEMADLVVGPDAYRDLPILVQSLLKDANVEQAVNVQLSLEETYADVTPVRHNPNDVSAFISVMRGCNNMCSYCVVPFTRGRERSRPFDSILSECQQLYENGVKEVVLLGQNVNSYHDKSEEAVTKMPANDYQTSNDGFTNLFRLRGGAGYYFSDLVAAVSDVSPELRVRFTSPHPKDYPPELLSLMAERDNVCSHLHMPAQSGSSSVLERMRRGYTREAYLQLIGTVRDTIPDVAISSDFITGFCGETEEEHLDTLSLMELVAYDQAYMFAYSMRGKTHAHRKMQDGVSQEIKSRRLQEVINMFRTKVQERNNDVEVGRLRLVLVEGESKRSTPENKSLQGRTDQNKRIVFTAEDCWMDHAVTQLLSQIKSQGDASSSMSEEQPLVSLQPGDYAVVLVTEARGHTLRGQALWRTSLTRFHEMGLNKTDKATLQEASTLSNAILYLNADTEEQESLTQI